MARRVIATAAVEVSGDTDAFRRSMDDVERIVRRAADNIEGELRDVWTDIARSADRAGRDMQSAMDRTRASIGDTVIRLTQVEDSLRELIPVAGRVGEAMERELREAANGAAASLSRLAADGRISGEQVEFAFREAAAAVDDVFERLDNGNAFTGLANDAERAGERIESSFREAARQSENHLRGLDSLSWGRLGAIGAGAAIVQLTQETIRFGFSVTQQIEQAEAQFRGLTESEEEAQRVLAEAIDFAKNTPFELAGLTQMSAQLLAVGSDFGVTTDNVFDFMTTLGNATAALGQGEGEMARVVKALGQMSGAGRVLSQDMNQLTQALPGFNPWKALADGTGIAEAELRKLAREGALTEVINEMGGVDVAIGHILDGMEEIPGAAGAMDRQMGTLAGTFEKFRDEVGLALTEGLAPFVEQLKALMGDPTILAAVATLAEAFGGLLTEAFAALMPHLLPLAEIFSRLLTALSPLLGLLDPIAFAFGSILTALEPLIAVLMRFIEPLIGPLMLVLEALQPALNALAAVLAEQLQTVLVALLPVILELVEMFLTLAPLLPPLVELFVLLATRGLMVIAALLPALLPLLNALTRIFAEIVPTLTIVLETVVLFVDQTIGQFTRLIAAVVTPIANFIETIINFFADLFDTLVGNSIIPDLVNAIIYWFEFMIAPIRIAVEVIRTVVTAVFNAIRTVVETIMQAISSVVSTIWNAIRNTVTTIVNSVRDTISNVFNAIADIARRVWNSIKEYVINPVVDLYNKVVAVIGDVRDAISRIFNAIKDTVGNIWDGIKTIVGNAVDWVARKVDSMLGPLDEAIGKVRDLFTSNVTAKFSVAGHAEGGVFDRAHIAAISEGNKREAVVPMTNPGRAMEVIREAGIDDMVLSRMAARGGPLVEMHDTVIQDATDADLVAQRTVHAMNVAMVAA